MGKLYQKIVTTCLLIVVSLFMVLMTSGVAGASEYYIYTRKTDCVDYDNITGLLRTRYTTEEDMVDKVALEYDLYKKEMVYPYKYNILIIEDKLVDAFDIIFEDINNLIIVRKGVRIYSGRYERYAFCGPIDYGLSDKVSITPFSDYYISAIETSIHLFAIDPIIIIHGPMPEKEFEAFRADLLTYEKREAAAAAKRREEAWERRQEAEK